MRNSMKTGLLTVGALFLMSATAFAAGDEGLPWSNFIMRSINAAIFIGLIWYFGGKIIRNFLTARKKNIVFELEEAERLKNEAEAHLVAMEKRIVNVETECTKLLEEGREQAERMKDAIIADAQRQAKEIVASAQKGILQQEKIAFINLREQLAEEIIQHMKKELSVGLDPKKQQELIDESLLKVVLQ